ncbi:MAG: NUDIX domain-containing protein [Nocardioides sp.]
MHHFASVVLVDDRGWILLQERDQQADLDPEKWGFVGGHREPGEDYLACAYRELTEETGLTLTDGLELVGEFQFFSEPCDETDEFQLFACRTHLTDADIVCGEGRQIVFVDPADAAGLDLTASAQIALPAFLESDLYRTMGAA